MDKNSTVYYLGKIVNLVTNRLCVYHFRIGSGILYRMLVKFISSSMFIRMVVSNTY